MEETLGARISALRKKAGLTQECLGEKLGVSAQAVSKWENDISAPDISILLPLAHTLGTTTDYLLGVEPFPVRIDTKTAAEAKYIRIFVDSSDGDSVRINLPLKLARLVVKNGAISSMAGSCGYVMDGIDLSQLLLLAEQGALGELLSVETEDGNHVRIAVEA